MKTDCNLRQVGRDRRTPVQEARWRAIGSRERFASIYKV